MTNPENSNSEIIETHTYPPRSQGDPVRFSEYAETPFARGFNETLDPSEINIKKGSVMFSSRFVDSMDNFNNDSKDGWKD